MSKAGRIDALMGIVFAMFGVWGLIPAAGGTVLGLFPVNTAMCVIALVAAAVLFYGAVSTVTARTVARSVGTATWQGDGRPWAVFTTERIDLNTDVSQSVRARGL